MLLYRFRVYDNACVYSNNKYQGNRGTWDKIALNRYHLKSMRLTITKLSWDRSCHMYLRTEICERLEAKPSHISFLSQMIFWKERARWIVFSCKFFNNNILEYDNVRCRPVPRLQCFFLNNRWFNLSCKKPMLPSVPLRLKRRWVTRPRVLPRIPHRAAIPRTSRPAPCWSRRRCRRPQRATVRRSPAPRDCQVKKTNCI